MRFYYYPLSPYVLNKDLVKDTYFSTNISSTDVGNVIGIIIRLSNVNVESK